MVFLVNIGFLDIRFLDILDILVFTIIIFKLYQLVLKGGLAFNILIGVVVVILLSVIAKPLNMTLLSGILGQFLELGFIGLLIIFQPEMRRVLLSIGTGSKKVGSENVFTRLFNNTSTSNVEKQTFVSAIIRTVESLSRAETGALIVIAKTSQLITYQNNGTKLMSNISSLLLESIFNKTSPLHDGAVIIAENQIKAAGCTLPTSSNENLPKYLGTRHKAGIGITEVSDATSIIVSEETGQISIAQDGELYLIDEGNKDFLRQSLEEALE